MAWFQLLMNGDPTDPNDYNLVTSPGCSGSLYVCAIQTGPDVNNKPIINTSLRNEMITALNNKGSTTNILLRTNP